MDALTEDQSLNPLKTAKRLVIKIGSALLVDWETGEPARAWLATLASDIVAARARGQKVVIVSSGATALGRRTLKLSRTPALEEKQAAAAVGQPKLMRAWEEAFAAHGVPVAQALLTPDDTEVRRRWLNGRATLETLLALGAVPIINENDTVATVEMRYGDNDRLAARVAQMISADALILLSDVDGLYESDPRRNPDAKHVPVVRKITPFIEAMAGGVNVTSGVGSGGMRTKIDAAKIAFPGGCATAVTKGDQPHPLARLAEGGLATWFIPSSEPRAAYKAWIAGSLAPQGAIGVDAGAVNALKKGASLLPAGVTSITGAFEKGDAVRIVTPDGDEIARGIARYDSEDAQKIRGLKSDAIEAALGYAAGAALVHADDLVLTGH
ncbi:MAG: glutamate 5-kinase [Caulobacterales bacterium]